MNPPEMRSWRAIFLGSPEFAARVWESVLTDQAFEWVGAITQPDKPKGRGLKLTPTPVKILAEKKGIPVISPHGMTDPIVMKALTDWKAEIALVVAFGKILPISFLAKFPGKAFNLHASLLPKYRGAAPLQRAIEAGEKTTGVTLQILAPELDAGPIIGFREFPITWEDDALTLLEKCLPASQELLKEDLLDYLHGNKEPRPQDSRQVSWAPKIRKEECFICWNMSPQKIHNRIRAFVLGPGAWTWWRGQRLKIWKTQLMDISPPSNLEKLPVGGVWGEKEEVWVKCGPWEELEGSQGGQKLTQTLPCLKLVEVQLENRPRMDAWSWWLGLASNPHLGVILGGESGV